MDLEYICLFLVGFGVFEGYVVELRELLYIIEYDFRFLFFLVRKKVYRCIKWF